MKLISEKKALAKLHGLKSGFAERISTQYEHKAKSCLTCETQGACCIDAHFVNVHITRLEAAAIRDVLRKLPDAKRDQVYDRIDAAIAKYDLTGEGETFAKTYACPLFEKGTGCLVHEEGKPLPCIHHACYENEEDLPPDDMLAEQEGRIEKLNKLTYGCSARWQSLPLAIRSAAKDGVDLSGMAI